MRYERLSQETKRDVVEMYENGEKTKRIKNKHGITQGMLYRILDKDGSGSNRRPKEYGMENETVVSMYQNGKTCAEIAEKYGCSNGVIYRIIRKSSVEMRSPSVEARKYTVNHNAFNKLDASTEYWLGFIMADGCISENSGSDSLSVCLARCDEGHLKKFLNFLESDYHICQYVGTKGSDLSSVTITSQKICDKLRGYGIKPRKTGREKAESVELLNSRHFWRGCVDGDGSIVTTQSTVIQLTCSKDLCKQFRAYINSKIDDASPSFYRKGNGIEGSGWQVAIYGDHAKKLISHLYNETDVYLSRKKEDAINAI
jgi:transposase-like protein